MEKIQQLSSIDIHYLVKEFQSIIDGKIENIYQIDKIFYLQIYKNGFKKLFLKIMLPSFIYLTESREEIPRFPASFCSILRKQIKGSKITNIEQIDLERIIKISFRRKDKVIFLYIELFGTGNIIICNENNKIIFPFEYQKWKDRTIKGGLEYILPERNFNLKKATKDEINNLISITKMNHAVTFIAKEMNLGGNYAEVLCEKMNIEKTAKPTVIDAKSLILNFNKLINQKDLKINDLLNTKAKNATKNEANRSIKYVKKKNKNEIIIDAQKEIKKKQETIIEDANIKAEIIYKNYSLLQNILNEIKEIKKKFDWKEIKEKTKDHKIIKKINEKQGKIIVNIE